MERQSFKQLTFSVTSDQAICFSPEAMLQSPRRSPSDQISWLQQRFNELHEELYKRGGIKPVNAAIDELGKLIFLRLHAEKYPHYVLSDSRGKGMLFTSLFDASYVRRQGARAVQQLQDAFEEIYTLPCYMSIAPDGGKQPIFPYKETLRLNQPLVLAQAISILNSLTLRAHTGEQLTDPTFPLDVLGLAYDVFLRGKYDSSGGLGTHLTPSPVVQAMTEMALKHISDEALWQCHDEGSGRNRPSFMMGDICCGTGRFIMAAMGQVRRRLLLRAETRTDAEGWWSQMRRCSFFGGDQAEASIVKARINMLMYGEEHPQLIVVEDSIIDERIDKLAGKLGLILTNPPFGSGRYVSRAGLEKMRNEEEGYALGWSWKRGGTQRRALKRADPAVLFMDRNLGLLKPGGIFGIVLPDGILGSMYSYVHDYILGKLDPLTGHRESGRAILLAVVSLPKGTFAISGTVAKTSFILLQKIGPHTPPQRSVFVAMAEHVGFLKKGTVEVIDPAGNDLIKIAQEYASFVPHDTSEIQELAQRPPISSVPHTRFVDTLVAQAFSADRQKAVLSIQSLGSRSSPLKALATLVKTKTQTRSESTAYFISVLHVDERATIDWVAAATYDPQTGGIKCCPGDILYSCINPRKPRMAVIPLDIPGEILCSKEFAVLRPKGGIDPHLLTLALRSDLVYRQVVPLARGTSSSRMRVRPKALLSVYVPYWEDDRSLALAQQFKESVAMARKAMLTDVQVLKGFESELARLRS